MAQEGDFEFILTTVLLGQKADSPIHKSLSRAGIDEVTGIKSLAEWRIENLKYEGGTFEKAILTELLEGYQQRLICCKASIQMDAGMMVHEDWQNLVTKDEFQEFRVISG